MLNKGTVMWIVSHNRFFIKNFVDLDKKLLSSGVKI